jgi:hypothetical protein
MRGHRIRNREALGIRLAQCSAYIREWMVESRHAIETATSLLGLIIHMTWVDALRRGSYRHECHDRTTARNETDA